MDEFEEFFNIGKFANKRSRTEAPEPKPEPQPVPMPVPPPAELAGSSGTSIWTSYVEQYPNMGDPADVKYEPEDNAMDDISVSDSEMDYDNILDEEVARIYDDFPLRDRHDERYVIDEIKDEILSNIERQTATIIEGPVGCGKSTRVPQWILRDCQLKKQACKIIVTQPRRISAVSLARRVSEENGYEVGTVIGYRIGQYKAMSKYTRLEFVTVGVLLKSLVLDRNINQYTHIIIDEVHERNKDMDFLLIIVKKLIARTSRKIKVILMSATFDVNLFATYFTFDKGPDDRAAVVKIPEKSMYNVSVSYLNEIKNVISVVPSIHPDHPFFEMAFLRSVPNLIKYFDFLDEEEMRSDPANATHSRCAVLMFLPGIHEIDCMTEILDADSEVNGWLVLPLHSIFSAEEQHKIFYPAPLGYRKIIVSSNIAESSITLPDIKYVVDFCQSRILVSENKYESLKTKWASKYNCIQRAGRAGRVRNGKVFRMVPREFYDNFITEIDPELKRCSLEHIILFSKTLDFGSPKEVLAQALNPPNLTSIHTAILNLKEAGALLPTVNGVVDPADGDLSHMGKILARLPLDYQISKIIILGYMLGCMEECIHISVAICTDNFFNYFRQPFATYISKLIWSQGSNSDCIAVLNAFNFIKKLPWGKNHRNKFPRERLTEQHLTIGFSEIREMFIKIKDIKRELEELGFKNTTPSIKTEWTDEKRKLLLKIVLAGGLYPKYFVIPAIHEDFNRETSKILRTKDVRNTIYLSINIDSQLSHPVNIYHNEIKELFRECTDDEIIVDFSECSRKIFVTFLNNVLTSTGRQNNGKVAFPVYKALKLYHNNYLTLDVMRDKDATQYLSSIGKSMYTSKSQTTDNIDIINALHPKMPHYDEKAMNVKVTHVINCEQFYVQRVDEATEKKLAMLHNILNFNPLDWLVCLPPVGSICAALLDDQKTYARMLVKKIVDDTVHGVFIDYGKPFKGTLEKIREHGLFDDDIIQIEALALECRLSKLSPCIIADETGNWTPASVKMFRELVKDKTLLATVYSVYNGIVSLQLYDADVNINDTMINAGFAVLTDEYHESIVNYDMRSRDKYITEVQKKARSEDQNFKRPQFKYPKMDYEKRCGRKIKLNGPFSPLSATLHGVVQSEKNKIININQSSINSVLLHSDPQFRNERLLVATQIYETERMNVINLRNTTLMPNIPGLPAILALLFCPKAELKMNLDKTHYNAVLCGLGHKDGEAICPDRDMVIKMDTNIIQEDLDDINFIRYSMDSLLANIVSSDTYLVSNEFQLEIISKIHERLNKLLCKPRGYRRPGIVRDEWKWDCYTDAEVITPQNMFGDNGIFQCHRSPRLCKLGDELVAITFAKMEKAIAFSESIELSNSQQMSCPICDTIPMDPVNLRIHLESTLHQQAIMDLDLKEFMKWYSM